MVYRAGRTLARVSTVLVLVMAPLIAHAAPPDSTTLILLGTGMPRPNPERSGPATAVTVGDRLFLFDAGSGVMRQLTAVGLLDRSREATVFITHLHSDHTLGYPDLILTTWVMGRKAPLEIHGPPGLKRMTDLITEAWSEDIDIRTHGLEREPEGAWKVDVHEIASDRIRSKVVYDSAGVRVTAIPVPHGNWEHAYGYRIDTPDKSIVISGDTAYSPLLAEVSKDADILVHEVYPEQRLKPEDRPGGELWPQYMREFHTSDVEVGRLAASARVKLVVLHHVVWMGATPEELVAGVRRGGYSGPVRVGEDLERY